MTNAHAMGQGTSHDFSSHTQTRIYGGKKNGPRCTRAEVSHVLPRVRHMHTQLFAPGFKQLVVAIMRNLCRDSQT